MPARSERIYLCPAENGQPGWVMPFPAWWNRDAFFEKYGSFAKQGARWFDTGNSWYVDYAMLLSMGEVYAWDKECRKSYAKNPPGQNDKMIEDMRLLEIRLNASRWIIVESYEWESGLD